MTDKLNSNLPLTGIKVVELASFVAIPNVSRFLADYGAEVIKVEAPAGDPLRYTGSIHKLPVSDDENPLFTVQNANKKFISLNLKTERGIEVIKKLISEADIFITSMLDRQLVKMGLDDKTLTTEMPGLVYVKFNGYGEKGAEASLPGVDMVSFWARSGALNDWAYSGEAGLNPGSGSGGEMAAAILTGAVTAALYGAKMTGKGQVVSTSLYGTGIWYNSTNILSSQFGNKLPKKAGTAANPLWACYECADGKIFLGAANFKASLPAVCEVLGLDFKEASTAGAALTDMLCQKIKLFKRDELIKALREKKIICGESASSSEIGNDAQALENNYIVPVEFPSGNVINMPQNPVHFSDAGKLPYRPAGEIGRDTDKIMKSLGYSDAEISAAKEAGEVK